MTENLKTVNFQDLELVGVDCGDTFTWIRGERYYYAAKGLSEPKRYEACRLKRKLTLVPEEVRLTGVSPRGGKSFGELCLYRAYHFVQYLLGDNHPKSALDETFQYHRWRSLR